MKKILFLLLTFLLLPAISVEASSQWFDLGSGWKIRLDSPHIETKAWHIHYYYKNDHKWCIRLDNAKKCDSSSCTQEPPKWVKTDSYDIRQVKDKIQMYNTTAISKIKDIIPTWALASLGAIMLFISVISFFIPFDDAFTAAYWVWLLA